MRRHDRILAFTALTLMSACFEGGANPNQRTPGNQDDGVGLSLGEFAIHPSGDYFLSKAGRDLLVGAIESGKTRIVSDVRNPSRLAFAHGDPIVYVTTISGPRVNISAYDLRTDAELWQHPVEPPGPDSHVADDRGPTLKVTTDDRHLLLVQGDRIDVLDTVDGVTRKTFLFQHQIVDVDLLEPSARVLVTLAHAWQGERVFTRVSFIDLERNHQHIITVPNCSDEMAVMPFGRFAFLAPTTCRRDPVSVIDLERERWIRNLPGFGPVAIAPGGDMAIAFLDATSIDSALFDDVEQIPSSDEVRYHVMFIDTTTLEFATLPVGDTLPRYALTPAGNVLLVDSASWYEEGKLRLVTIASKEMHTVTGPDVRLDRFVITSDSLRLFGLDGGLYDLSLEAAHVERVGLHFVPTNINITPDDAHLLLREDATTMWVFHIPDMTLVRSIRVSSH